MGMPIIIEPRFNVMKVDIGEILQILYSRGITCSMVARIVGTAYDRVYDWGNKICRPKCVFKTYLVVDLGCRFITPKEMNKCGVTG